MKNAETRFELSERQENKISHVLTVSDMLKVRGGDYSQTDPGKIK